MPSKMPRLATGGPFHLQATVRVLQRRPTNLIDVWEHQRYRRAIRIQEHPVLIEVQNRGSVDVPDLRISVLPRATRRPERAEAARVVAQILGLAVDVSAGQRRAEATVALRSTARALRGLRPPRYPDLFETFANVIPFQQLSLEAGMAVTSRLVRRYGEMLRLDGHSHYLFPRAESVADSRLLGLKQCGLSTKKALALRAIAHMIASGTLTKHEIEYSTAAAALERLVDIPGIGPWSAALVLLRGFGRLDVFPQPDTGAQSSLAKLLRLRSHRSLAQAIERFGPYRGYLYFYGIASRLLAAGLIDPALP